jgi:hypothetical protein
VEGGVSPGLGLYAQRGGGAVVFAVWYGRTTGLGQCEESSRTTAAPHLASYGTLGHLDHAAGGGHRIEVSADRRRGQPEQLGQRGRAHRALLEDRLGHPVAGAHVDAISHSRILCSGDLGEVDGGFHNAYVT